MDRCVPVKPAADKPASFYLKPRQSGTKVAQTGAKIQAEEEVVKQCTDYLRKNGWVTKTIYTGGIPIGSGKYATNPAKGVPDCIMFHIGTKKIVWIEYKKSHGGIVSQEQKEWHNLIRYCGGEVWVVNSLKLLKELLDETVAKSD